MLQKLKLRQVIGSLLITYQIVIDFLKSTTQSWYYDLAAFIGLKSDIETYEGPLIWVAIMILHRAIIHTIVIFCFTANKAFTHLYGIIECVLIVGLVVLFVAKLIIGEWFMFSFDFFDTFLSLLKSPLLLIIFLPSYFILEQKNGVFKS